MAFFSLHCMGAGSVQRITKPVNWYLHNLLHINWL